MKTKFQTFAVLLIAALATLFAQGPLTPPGAPAPTMKTLDQIEARTPISSAPFTINQSGSYYLTTNIAVTAGNAITITADNVTLDLNGFTLSSTEASPAGIGILLSGGRAHIHILNGHIKGSVTYSGGLYSGGGFAYGISYSGGSPRNVRISGVSVSRCLQHGIDVQFDNSTVVESCTVHTVGGHGIVASSVSHSAAKECGMRGINADTASDSRGESTGSERGVNATTAQNCYGTSGSGNGVTANTAQNCYGRSVGNGHGVSGSNAQNCYGFSSGSGNGVNVLYAAHNCFGQSVSGTGISASVAENSYGTTGGSGNGVNAFDSAHNCSGSSSGGHGVNAAAATNCKGYSGGSGSGVYAKTAQNCYGASNSGFGIDTEVAMSCHGTSNTLPGLFSFTASNCYGATVSGGSGVSVRYTASNCVGSAQSGGGVQAGVALNCVGVSESGGTGVTAANLFTGSGIAQNCLGVTTGTGVSARIAIGCYGGVTANPPVSAFREYFCGSGPYPYP